MSQLYDNAVNALGSRRASWKALEQRIGAIRGPERPNEDGPDVVEMIRTEHQLSDDPTQALPSPMSGLLGDLCGAAWPSDAMGFRDTYNGVVRQYALRGQPIAADPDRAYRYLNGPAVFQKGIRPALPNVVRDSLGPLMDAAERTNRATTWQDVLVEVAKPVVWDAFDRQAVPLAAPGMPSMFVTLDDPGHSINRNSATKVHAALALWKPRSDCFVEARLAPRADKPLKMPTFADAGWFRFFRSAGVGEPNGWTRPHDPGLPPQPEAVREPAALAELQSSQDLRILPI